jgi:iron complex transport system substrate-binding protein
MLDAQKHVIGISTNVYQESVFPYYGAMDKRIRNHELPTPGNWDFVNMEMLVGLNPDLVIIWSHQQESIAAMEEKGIVVYGVFIESFKDIYREINDLGELTGTGKRAEELIDYVRKEIETIQKTISQTSSEINKRVYYMWAQAELQTSGKNSTVNELIELAGGKNVAGHIRQEHLVINLENIITWDPEVVVMWHNTRMDPEDILSNNMWRSISAVKHRRVYEFPDVFSCDLWTLKYLYPVQLVAKWCYPEHFKDMDLLEKKRILFQKLYGEKLNLSDNDNLQ